MGEDQDTTRPAGGGNRWAVSLGNFASENLARSAASNAQGAAGAGARSDITRVAQGRTTLYSARVNGLTRTQAEQACQKLRAAGNCTLVAPGV